MDLATFPFKHQPFAHQAKELLNSASKQSWAYFMEMGTGKSKIIIDNFTFLYMEGKIDTVVIMAKKGEYANWKWVLIPDLISESLAYEAFLFSTYGVQLSAGKAGLKSILDPTAKRLRIFIINIESLQSASAQKALTELYKSSRAVFFALDESTCAKNTSSARSKLIYQWSAKAHYRRIATGSPVTQSPLDLWGQSIVLGKGLLGAGSYFAFRGDYAVMETVYLGNRSIQQITGYKNLDRLDKYLDLWSTRLTKSQCLDLPPKLYSKHIVELTPQQQELYTKLREEALLELDGVDVEVTHVLTQIVKLHQIACGQLKLSDTQYQSIPNNRIPALLEILENYPGKVIIWANYRQTLVDVAKALGEAYTPDTVALYYGATTPEARRAAVDNFQNPKSPVRFFVSNPQAGGYGLTLTQANLVIYYSNSYNLEHRLQSEDRAHRIGQEHPVTYIDLLVPGTVDERIVDVLRSKKELANIIMRERNFRSWI